MSHRSEFIFNRCFEVTPADGTDIHSAVVSVGNTGNGSLSSLVIDVELTDNHDWEIECITAVANGGIFSVKGFYKGKVRRTLPNATVGVAYSEVGLAFTLTDGSADFIVGDKFKFSTVRGTSLLIHAQGNSSCIAVDFDSISPVAVNVEFEVIDGILPCQINRLYATGTNVSQAFAVWRE